MILSMFGFCAFRLPAMISLYVMLLRFYGGQRISGFPFVQNLDFNRCRQQGVKRFRYFQSIPGAYFLLWIVAQNPFVRTWALQVIVFDVVARLLKSRQVKIFGQHGYFHYPRVWVYYFVGI